MREGELRLVPPVVPHDPPVGQGKRDVAVHFVLEGSRMQPVRMMYRDLDGKIHERVMQIPFDAACEIAKDYSKRGMTEVMVWRPLETKKVGGNVRENENQVDNRESKNRFGNHAKSNVGLPVAESNTTQLISYYIKEKGDAHYERIRERFKNKRKAPAVQMPRVRGCPALLRRGDPVVRQVQTGMARLGGD